MFNFVGNHVLYCWNKSKLDPVGSTVHYEVMKLCTGQYRTAMHGWYFVVLSQYEAIIDDIGSVED